MWVLGIPAAAVVTFRVLSAVNGILEHANVRVRPAIDTFVSLVWVTPNMHKVHHSRDEAETNANYGNLLTLPDRLFRTFVPTVRAFSVKYGLDDVDPAETRSVAALLAMPWRFDRRTRHEDRVVSNVRTAELVVAIDTGLPPEARESDGHGWLRRLQRRS